MTVEELYIQIDGDYSEMFGRMRSDELIEKFVTMFLNDTSCPDLIAAWNAGDETGAFDAAHKAKGVCGNLSLSALANLTSEITEVLRPGNESLRAEIDVNALVADLDVRYQKTTAAIRSFATSK